MPALGCVCVHIYMEIVTGMYAFPFCLSLCSPTQEQRDRSPQPNEAAALVFAGLRFSKTG